MTAPTLTGLDAATFAENTVNATPQIIDSDVTLTDPDNDFNGGTLRVTGLLSTDTVSIQTGPVIYRVGADIYYDADGAGGGAAVIIGTASGGTGSTFTVTFNASATTAIVELVIESLTYANSSNSPTATHYLSLNVTDASGASLAGAPGFTQLTGGSNPVNGITVGAWAAPTLIDLDNDGDLDILQSTTTSSGVVRYFENTGTAVAPSFTQRTGAANPMDSFLIDRGVLSAGDIDGDGDYDLFAGSITGGFRYFQNTGSAAAPTFVERTGASNPLHGFTVTSDSSVELVDLDGDGDLDVVGGSFYGTLAYFQNTGTTGAPVFVQRTGGSNPFNGIDVGFRARPSLVDLDGDGDKDLVVGENGGTLLYYRNTGTSSAPVFTAQTGANNPWNGLTLGGVPAPEFADLDGDGDADLIVGLNGPTVTAYFQNTTVSLPRSLITITAENDAPAASGLPSDVTVTEDTASNLDVSTVSIADVDSVTISVVLSANGGTIAATSSGGVTVSDSGTSAVTLTGTAAAIDAWLNTASNLLYTGAANVYGSDVAVLTVTADDGSGVVTLGTVNIDITAVDDAPSAATVPSDVTVTEDAASDLDLSAITLSDMDSAGAITVVLTASAGTMTASSSGGVTVSNSGTGAITLSGTVADIDTWLNTASAIRYTSAANASGNNAATLTITADSGSGAATVGVVNIDITGANDAPTLTGVATSTTFSENTVNATPQVIDTDVTFVDPDANLVGGTLTVSGLLAEDRISVLNEGSGAGQISIDGMGVIRYGGLQIGNSSGGVGATFTVSLLANVTVEAVDALIEVLTYANVSDTPTAARTLNINVTDAAGAAILGANSYSQLTGASNPLNGFDVGLVADAQLVDLDNDGDLDLVAGFENAGLKYFQNTGTATSPAFTQLSGASNPFNGLATGIESNPFLVDLDNDGDKDLVNAGVNGQFTYFENTGSASAPAFTQRTGAANPLDGIDVGDNASIAVGDLDGDGDKDIIAGRLNGTYYYLENTGSVSAAAFTLRTGAANPMDGFDFGSVSHPFLIDYDRDGDLDLVSGGHPDTTALTYFENTGTVSAPVFVQRTGAANPLNDINHGGLQGYPTFGDLDGDGDPDLLIGQFEGTFAYYRNVGGGVNLTVNVTAEADGPTGSADTLTYGGTSDTISALGGDDVIDAGGGNDTIDGGTGHDELTGGDGDDYLKGGTGADDLFGGLGNDTYIVDDAGDTTDETGGDGIDLVRASLSWTLGTGLENLDLLSGGGAINGTGNELDNVITGNSYANTLDGESGADDLVGAGGDDVLNGGDDDDDLDGGNGHDQLNGGSGADDLVGGAGNDTLNGGSGSDNLNGGLGNDTYVIDDNDDNINEASGAGTDTVMSSINMGLGPNVEHLTLTGTGNITGDGNSLRNTINGNSGNNVLHGWDEIDTINGGAGVDTLYGDAGNDVLNGGDHDDWLQGGAGGDKLTGGAGADQFQFMADDIRRSGLGQAPEKDQILDLNFATGDWINLSQIDANILTGGVDDAFVFVGKFTRVAGQAVLTYAAGTGITTLQLDVDGDGKADFRVEINGNVTGSTGNLYTGGGDADGGWLL